VAKSPLQKYPGGLLELLSLKTLGKAPELFDDTVAPVIEVGELYGMDRLRTTSTAGAAGAVTGALQEIVDGPNRYRAIGGSIGIGAAAGTWLVLGIGIRMPGVAGPVCWLNWAAFTPRIGVRFAVGGFLGEPLSLPSGAVIELETYGDAAGADHVRRVTNLFEALGT